MANVNETFRFIEYSNSSRFIKTPEGRIELKKYTEDLVLYSNFDGLNRAMFGKGVLSPTASGTLFNSNNGVFGQHVYLQNAFLRYDKSNFYNLTKEGSIQFRIKTDFNNAVGSQSFSRTTNPIITSLPSLSSDFNFGGGSLDLRGDEEKRIEYNVLNVETMVQEGTIDFFFKSNYSGAPTKNVQYFDLYNGSNNNNRITITHQIDGNIYVNFYDQVGDLIDSISFAWASDPSSFFNLQVNFNFNLGQSRVFINGTQYGITSTATGTRVPMITGYVSLGSTLNEYISNFLIDDFAIFNRVLNTTNYRPRTNTFSESLTGLILLARYNLNMNLNIGSTPEPINIIPDESAYRFRLRVDGTIQGSGDILVNLNPNDTLNQVRGKIATAVSSFPVSVAIVEGKITISSNTNGALLEILPPETGRNLLQVLDGVDPPKLPNGPSSDVIIFELFNQIDNKNRITFTHTTNSHIIIRMWDNNGVLKVNNDIGEFTNWSHYWYAFEFNWNNSIAQFFIDGEMKSVFSTNFERQDSGSFLTIRSGINDFYRFDELIIYNKYKNTTNFTVPTSELSAYDMSNPFIDIHFGNGFRENEVVGININSSSGINFTVKIGNNWYYYFSGSWRLSDGSFSQTIQPSVIETKFHELFFDENTDLVIRAYFSSDGQSTQWIDEVSIVIESNSDVSAVITGEIPLVGTFDLSSDQHVTIYTNLGSAEIDLTSTIPGLPAFVTGTEDLLNGYDFATNPDEITINGQVIPLNLFTDNVYDLVDYLNTILPMGITASHENGLITFSTDEIGSVQSIDLSGPGLLVFGIAEDEYFGSEPDLTQVTADDIIDAINAANIPGLMPAALDSNNRLVLISRDRGEDAYVAIAEGSTSNALDIIWGNATSDSGQQATGPFIDYSVIKDWIRSQLGAPISPVELTEEQLENAISLAVYWYNYYRNSKENLIHVLLEGNPKDGYKIPDIVGGEDNIIEIIVRPRFPFAYYTGGDVGNIMSNVYMQWMFQRGRGSGFQNFVGDYYLTLSTQKDYSIILGTQLTWRFYNKRLFISPPPVGMEVMIVFRSALTIEEINTNTLIREYSLGEAKKTLGTIRSTFGGVIPGGGENINLNAEILKSEGKEEVDTALGKMQGLMEPFGFDYG